ncbi:F-box protein skip24 [Thalictrum thalictroides]|uniref:F-box protein skip24 n=1 Tax=Thalictrum thalictroides TaxID=46969 RepID=A0A7J6VVP7_THATH|nr:F-box protein skip24 [Thalictrum thalictroides]
MAALPDEIWREILQIGIQKSKLNYKDLCFISISSKRLNKLSNESTLWSSLLTLDYPQTLHQTQSTTPFLKNIYKSKFEREKQQKLASHRRAILRIESQIHIHQAKIKEFELQLIEENEKLRVTINELKNLERVRSSSIALNNVWQPEIVRGMQKKVVEQCGVSFASRVSTVEMEIRVCKQQIQVLDKSYRDEKQRLDSAKKELRVMKYHPLRDFRSLPEGSLVDESIKIQRQRKKLKKVS